MLVRKSKQVLFISAPWILYTVCRQLTKIKVPWKKGVLVWVKKSFNFSMG